MTLISISWLPSLRIPVPQILVISGLLVEVASTHTQIAFTVVAAGSSLFVHVFGGVGFFTGCAFSRAVIAGAVSTVATKTTKEMSGRQVTVLT
jgi:hypothetical protein